MTKLPKARKVFTLATNVPTIDLLIIDLITSMAINRYRIT